ncbi:hypothetical protein PROFUN_16150 [Planoprotostelium fungivorum]|uniref:Uncharacterized protein n=1 Tax=Planoprotostelium fungivorum TaxID=1890364 RepID=A0A2P6MSN4_9EUKA|nr:hypothetical protein PROFUN_16150 [Planoprotostelium fungivorum]
MRRKRAKRNTNHTSRSQDTIEMATSRPRNDSYLRTLTTIDTKRDVLAADVRRLTTQQAGGAAKAATAAWIYNMSTEGELNIWLTFSDEDFVDAVKAKGPHNLVIVFAVIVLAFSVGSAILSWFFGSDNFARFNTIYNFLKDSTALLLLIPQVRVLSSEFYQDQAPRRRFWKNSAAQIVQTVDDLQMKEN